MKLAASLRVAYRSQDFCDWPDFDHVPVIPCLDQPAVPVASRCGPNI
jgi:hypothetical protein